MTATFEQVHGGRWPSGIDKALAVLRLNPEELEPRYGVRFTPGCDDLDEFQEAALRLGSGRPVLLMRHRQSPGRGTTVSIDDGDDASEALDELRHALDLAAGDLTWISDDARSAKSRSSVFEWLAELLVGRRRAGARAH
jgi:hypothetical protein